MVSLSLIFMLSAVADAHAERRVALVVGNSSYQYAPQLPTPAKDAASMARLFEDAGFDVVEARSNVNLVDFKRAIRKFEDAATDSDIAIVFYAGHGVELGGTNYLIPVDAKLAADRDVQDEAILLDRLVASVDSAKRLRLVILDASRANPFINKMNRTMASVASGNGLTKVAPTSNNTLIAYAARAGSTADEGDGEHSAFTTALLANLTVPGLDVRLAFSRVRDQVLKMTDNRQEPFVYGSLGGGLVAILPTKISFPPSEVLPTYDDMKRDYQLIERIGTKSPWEVFLASHPNGVFGDLARAYLARLAAADSVSCWLDCIGDWIHTNKCDAAGDVCIEMAQKRCHAVLENSGGKCGADAGGK